MDGISLILILFALGIVGLFAFFLLRNTYTSDETKFVQAGVEVVYARKIIRIKGLDYPVTKVRGVRWETGLGSTGNNSRAIIQLDDMTRPIHKIDFMMSGDAEQFIQRLQLAMERTGAVTFRK